MRVSGSQGRVEDFERIENDAWADLYAAAPRHLRERLGIAHRVVDGALLLVCRGIDRPQFNRLASLGALAPARAETLDAALAEFRSAGVEHFLVGATPRARSVVEGAGLRPFGKTSAKLVHDTGEVPAPPSSELIVREIGPDHAGAFGRIAARCFGEPEAFGEWLAALPGRRCWHCYLAFDDDLPVATGALFVRGSMGWVGIGTTLPSHRGRRAQPALLYARLARAHSLGVTSLTSETGTPASGQRSPSFDNLRRAGFRLAYERMMFTPG